ncbi:putative E3 ubiquitin-protein ligase rf4 [Phtheirospermum japonicum]|uniref:Putative E3 ubiquitin-protein ligase rf4 n=1 Tax=Phtheirospermum japonicum TaxID=374723 RepID=A0A830BSV7_9LAMI|nr:putative E3 ubiquitin-protein ligase rf4 [Phtheirospermum japonicum]
MCMTEEISVDFIPCAHLVLCGPCNILHEKQGMSVCPSCRATIDERVVVVYRPN